jgi:hypothetical protein
MIRLYTGDSLDFMRSLASETVDSVITDPPYGLSDNSPAQVNECLAAWLAGKPYRPTARGGKAKRGFMDKTWDAWVPGPELWRECYRALKPGAYMLVFAGTRSMDLMSMGIRLAGFEIKDSIPWIYSQGFPKSKDMAREIDRVRGGPSVSGAAGSESRSEEEAAQSEQWKGWGTALKPSWEPILMARKPHPGTIAANVLKFGCGALNIDACRVPIYPDGIDASQMRAVNRGARNRKGGSDFGLNSKTPDTRDMLHEGGRWPANLVLSYPADEYHLRDDVTPNQLQELAGWLRANA